VGSRFLIGASAWLLGVASATAGSLYAIAQLGHGLVGQHTSQVSVAMVNAELRQDGATRTTGLAASPSPSASPKTSPSSGTRRSGGKDQVTPPPKYSTKWLTLRSGTVEAVCGPAGARLYATAAQGFEIDPDRFVAGPSATASVTFINSSIGVTLKVTCDSAGAPVTQVSEFQRGGWSPHHNE
jgi:hypothetical protein